MNELCDRSFSYTCFVVLSVLHSAATAKHPRGPASINSTYRVAAARCPHLASGRHSPRQSLARRGRQLQRDTPPRTAPPHPGASAEPRIARIAQFANAWAHAFKLRTPSVPKPDCAPPRAPPARSHTAITAEQALAGAVQSREKSRQSTHRHLRGACLWARQTGRAVGAGADSAPRRGPGRPCRAPPITAKQAHGVAVHFREKSRPPPHSRQRVTCPRVPAPRGALWVRRPLPVGVA